ncbi:MAG: hypothetical protein HY706_06965 [Candidatus Hydrogenedentes bacterium]|nr:hypothetical protein [Candidatus Hydrogenedentota bacterium]
MNGTLEVYVYKRGTTEYCNGAEVTVQDQEPGFDHSDGCVTDSTCNPCNFTVPPGWYEVSVRKDISEDCDTIYIWEGQISSLHLQVTC